MKYQPVRKQLCLLNTLILSVYFINCFYSCTHFIDREAIYIFWISTQYNSITHFLAKSPARYSFVLYSSCPSQFTELHFVCIENMHADYMPSQSKARALMNPPPEYWDRCIEPPRGITYIRHFLGSSTLSGILMWGDPRSQNFTKI
jgi:hypothetical protein